MVTINPNAEKRLWKDEWQAVIRRQRELLVFPSYDRETAKKLGLELMKQAEGKTAALQIMEGDLVVFACKLEGTNEENDAWIRYKYDLSVNEGYITSIESSGHCGGCIPLVVRGKEKPAAYVFCSGLQHYDDHQLVADAMAHLLGVEIPTLDI